MVWLELGKKRIGVVSGGDRSKRTRWLNALVLFISVPVGKAFRSCCGSLGILLMVGASQGDLQKTC